MSLAKLIRKLQLIVDLFEFFLIKTRSSFSTFSGDELVLTEMLFNGVFNDLTVAQCVALCSCFVVTENAKEDMPKLTKELAAPYKIMQVIHDTL